MPGIINGKVVITNKLKEGDHVNGSDYELSLNKLMILFLIQKAGLPLSNTQISEFLLDSGYTDYFSLQNYLSQMIDSGILKSSKITSHTLYDITPPTGDETLEFFKNHIPESIKDDMILYLKNNKYDIKSKFEVIADYVPEKTGDYYVQCIAREDGTNLVELNLRVSEKEEALKICDSWEMNSHEIYKRLLHDLLNE